MSLACLSPRFVAGFLTLALVSACSHRSLKSNPDACSETAIFPDGDVTNYSAADDAGILVNDTGATLVDVGMDHPTGGFASDASGAAAETGLAGPAEASPARLTIQPDSPQRLKRCDIPLPVEPVVFQVTNQSDRPVGPLEVTLAGATASGFQADASGCDLVPALGQCIVTVSLRVPGGYLLGTVTLLVKDPVSGATTAEIPITGELWACDPLWIRGPEDLGSVPVHTIGTPGTFTVTWGAGVPSGPLELHVSRAFLLSNDACTGVSLPSPWGSCTFDVSFAPISSGPVSDFISVECPYAIHSVPVSANGI